MNHKAFHYFYFYLALFTSLYSYAEESSWPKIEQQEASAPFHSFTGKVTKNKVRMRHLPSLESPILRELHQGDLVVVLGEADDFYAVQAPADIKGYIYRTFVLDNKIEGNRVNIRLMPDIDAPVIGQANSGDPVEGRISPSNNKWMEISLPSSVRFYIAKEYLDNVGDATLMSRMEKRKDEVNNLLNSTYLVSQSEMQKPFAQIHLDGIYENYNKIIRQYTDFPEQVNRAKELLAILQENYLQKKIAHLEAKTQMTQEEWQGKNSQLSNKMKEQQERLEQLEEQIKREEEEKLAQNNTAMGPLTSRMSTWIPVEQNIYQMWLENNEGSVEDFYHEQEQQAVALKGILEPYIRSVKNKPGDFVLVNQSNHLPIAYLYSTKVNLQDKLGQEISIKAIPRPNHYFAFPAYFVLEIE